MYVGLDVETGGAGDTSLLSAALILFDDDLVPTWGRVFNVIPDNKLYIVSAEGLNVNRISLTHRSALMTYTQAGTEVFNQLRDWSKGGREKLISLGYGIHGDIQCLTKHLLKQASWECFVSYHSLELGSLIEQLILAGKLPPDSRGGLSKLAQLVDQDEFNAYLDIEKSLGHLQLPEISWEWHNPYYDTLAAVGVIRGLKKKFFQS